MAGVRGAELEDRPGTRKLRARGIAPIAVAPASPPPSCVDLGARLLDLGERELRPGSQPFRLAGRLDPEAGALEQRDTNARLEPARRAVQRRPREPGGPRRAPEPAVLDDGDQRVELAHREREPGVAAGRSAASRLGHRLAQLLQRPSRTLLERLAGRRLRHAAHG